MIQVFFKLLSDLGNVILKAYVLLYKYIHAIFYLTINIFILPTTIKDKIRKGNIIASLIYKLLIFQDLFTL